MRDRPGGPSHRDRAQHLLQRIAGHQAAVAAAHDLHRDHTHPLAVRHGQQVFPERLPARHGIQRGEHGIEFVALDGLAQFAALSWPVTPMKRVTFCSRSFRSAVRTPPGFSHAPRSSAAEIPRTCIRSMRRCAGVSSSARCSATHRHDVRRPAWWPARPPCDAAPRPGRVRFRLTVVIALCGVE